MKTIKDIGEFGFIKLLEQENRDFFNKVVKGIGDDCAVLEKDENTVLLVSTELFIEDIHFLRKKTPPYELGIKVVNASLSDIAAMGGDALFLFSCISVSPDTKLDYMKDLYKGIKDACSRYKVDIVGGDTSRSLHRMAINVTVIGEMEKSRVVYRKGARPGDAIYVTGFLGDSAAGLRILKEELSVPEHAKRYLEKAHNMPEPDLKAGRLAAEHMLASAMIDISDGLVADLNHICEQSGTGAVLYLESLPISKELLSVQRYLPVSCQELALYGGEDYKLIVVVKAEKVDEFESLFKKHGLPCYRIGEITEEKGIKLVSHGRSSLLEVRGYVHF
jgi:thiamine-monophosphate kinase